MTLTDLYTFLTTASTAGMDSDRAAAIATVRAMIATPAPVVAPNTPWRIYPDILAEGVTLPALTYTLIDDKTEHTLDGASEGMYYPRVQIDIWANNSIDRMNLGLAVKESLDGYTGLMVGTEVCVLLWDNEIDNYEPERLQYRKTLDFRIIHN